MEKKKIAIHLIKVLSEEDKVFFKQKLYCGKTIKSANRLEKLFVALEKAIDPTNAGEATSTKLAKILKLSSPKKLDPFYTELIDELKYFLTLFEFNKEPFQQQLFLQKSLYNREEKEYIKELHLEIRNHITTKKNPSPEDYYHQAIFYNNLYNHPSTNTQKSEALVYLKNSEIYLDTFYWIQKLRLLIEKANRGITLSEEGYLLSELPSLPNLSEYTHNQNNHILSILASVYQFALAPFQEDDLNKIIDLIQQHSDNIAKEDKERIFNFLVSIIGFYIPTQQTNLSKYNIYQIYKLAFTYNWFVQQDGCIYFEDYTNVLGLAFGANDSELLEVVADEYIQYAPEGYEPFIMMLSKGYNFFLHKKWKIVLRTFSNQELPNVTHRTHFMLHRNLLELKSLFEIFIEEKIEVEDITSFLEKHQRFLQRKSTTYGAHLKNRFVKFLKLLKQLYTYLAQRALYNSDKKSAKNELNKWIKAVEEAGNKSLENPWLLEKGKELMAELESMA